MLSVVALELVAFLVKTLIATYFNTNISLTATLQVYLYQTTVVDCWNSRKTNRDSLSGESGEISEVDKTFVSC